MGVPARGKSPAAAQEAMLKELLPDYKTRTYYLSGPQVMVQAFATTLKTMGIKGGDIHTDYFPGFA
jgi:ferredoxin-NADP reductase